MAADPMVLFREYLKAALDHALESERTGSDKSNLKRLLARMKACVQANWTGVTPSSFMVDYLFCVGSIQKPYERRVDDKSRPSYWDRQLKLFRNGRPDRIAADEAQIRSEWRQAKADLSPRMINAVFQTAKLIQEIGWPKFRVRYLVLPADPTSDRVQDWEEALNAFDDLPMVGPALTRSCPPRSAGSPRVTPCRSSS